MDIDKEFAAANRRVQLGIERNYLIAMARLEGITPEEYAAKVDAERAQQAMDQTVATAQAFGRQIGEMVRSYRDFVNNVAEGIRQAFS